MAGERIILKTFFFSFSYPQYRPQRKSQNVFGGVFISKTVSYGRKIIPLLASHELRLCKVPNIFEFSN